MRIDRLARSTFDLFALVKQIVDAGAQFRSLAEPVGRHWHQHRAIDDCRSRRAGGRGTRPHQDAHGGGTQPGEGARPTYGPTAKAEPRAAEGSTAAAEGATLKELAKSYNVGRATISRL
jgi:DNA invertase Pin-like site-specific DNA recombinase